MGFDIATAVKLLSPRKRVSPVSKSTPNLGIRRNRAGDRASGCTIGRLGVGCRFASYLHISRRRGLLLVPWRGVDDRNCYGVRTLLLDLRRRWDHRAIVISCINLLGPSDCGKYYCE